MPEETPDAFDLSLYESADFEAFDAPLGAEVFAESLTEAQAPGEAAALDAAFPRLGDIDAGFEAKLVTVVAACADKDTVMVPYTGIRTPWAQARLWRRSRSTATVRRAIQQLKDNGAPYLAGVLEAVGPQATASNVTNALPGMSWHQWGEAADSYWEVDGRPEWVKLDGYKVYAEAAKAEGLTAGGFWRFKDWPHVQLRPEGNPRRLYSYAEIDSTMKTRFGEVEP